MQSGISLASTLGLRWLRLFGALAVMVLASACATPPPAPVEAPPAPTFESLMADAAKAQAEGSRARERELYRNAASVYPTRKEPWSRLADSYFEASDYGNAILAAQEVLQRDTADPVANSILAVSGLRVSTTALGALRQQQSLSSDTRGQAEDIVKTLREVLGEPVLVPKPPEPPPRPVRRTPRVPTTAAVPAPGTAVSPAAAVPAPAAPAAVRPAAAAAVPAAAAPNRPPAAAPAASAPANPFDRLR